MQYTFEEMKALVDEAPKLERKVAAHAHGTEGIKIATRAGVASIEHGSFLDEEGARMMAQRGTYMVPTMMAGEGVERFAKNGVLRGLGPRRPWPRRRPCERNQGGDQRRPDRTRHRRRGHSSWH